MKVVRCRTCGESMTVPSRSRPPEWFCSAACLPLCTMPGCSTLARGMSGRCWRHRTP